MASQPPPPRKKILPTGPSKIIKHMTHISYNRRDHELTDHQKSWAQSLNASLSGWQNRKTFLKTQLEARLEAKAKQDAEEAARQADIQAREDKLAPTGRIAVQEVDWKTKARNSIIKKKLTIGKDWTASTWNQKSNVHERLVLLEDDGFDITDLQNQKPTSDEISAIVVARAAAQQQLQQATAVTVTLEVPEADDQPFDPCVPYHPQDSSTPLKRKRYHGTVTDESADVNCPAPKKPKIKSSSEDELIRQALRGVKQKVTRRVFRPARSICQQYSVASRVVSSIGTAGPDQGQKTKPISTLDYLYATQPVAVAPNELLRLKSKGYEYMMNELRFLTDTNDDYSDDICMRDPDYDDVACIDAESDSPIDGPGIDAVVAQQTHLPKDTPGSDQQTPSINIYKSGPNCQVFHGDTLALAELFKVLRSQNLLHLVDWEWDGMRLAPSSTMEWTLSPETRCVLAKIENQLRMCKDTEGAVVLVERY